MTARRKLGAALALTLAGAPWITGCITQDDARVQQLLNQRGFGSRYVGDSNTQYYLGVGDRISVQDEQHPEFNDTFVVRPDGVIDPKNIDEVFVAGMTLPDVGETLTRRYREFNTTALIDVQLVSSTSKYYYVDGEVSRGGRQIFQGDTTLFTAIFEADPTILSDDDAVELIRPDPYHPLVVRFDYDDMLEGGWSRDNVEVRENDIIYVPPNIFGYLTLFTSQLFAPLQVIVASVFGASRLLYSFDTFGDTGRYGSSNRNRGSYGGYGMVLPGRQDFAMAVAPVDPTRCGE